MAGYEFNGPKMKRVLWLLRVLFARISNFFLIWSEESFNSAVRNHFGKLWAKLTIRSGKSIFGGVKSSVAEVSHEDIIFLLDQKSTPVLIDPGTPTNRSWIWATPIFNAGSGGHHDIFMFADESNSRANKNIIGLINGDRSVNIIGAKKTAREDYGYEDLIFADLRDFRNSDSELVIATGWQTFASAMRLSAKKHAYLVQDFEPNFYPASAQSVLAEATYKKSIACLTAGPWLSKKLRNEYGLDAHHFELGYDPKFYGEQHFSSIRDAIVIYFRQGTPRRASELMLEVLRTAAPRLSEFEIHFVGGIPNIDLPIEFVKHGRLTHSELGALYGRAAVTCSLSLTNTSLVPVEALACGSNVFTNTSVSNQANLLGTNASMFDLDIPTMVNGLVELALQTSVETQKSNLESVLNRDWKIQKKIAVDYLESLL